MKKLLLVILLSLPIKLLAQTQLEFEKVIEVPGKTKDQLYQSARQWFNETFGSSKAVLTIQDKETGELAGNCNLPFRSEGKLRPCTEGYVSAKISVMVKDGKFKIVMKKFIHKAEGGYLLLADDECAISLGLITTDAEFPYRPRTGLKKKVWVELKGFCADNFNTLASSLNDYLNNPDSKEW